MLLPVPFYAQEPNECGPVTLKMVLEYLGKKYEKERIKNLLDRESSGTTWTLDLARVAAKLKFNVEFYTTSLELNEELFSMSWYQQHAADAEASKAKIAKLVAECRRYNVNLQERSLTQEEVLKKVNKDCIPIICLDWGKIKNVSTYIGHFVPVIGYDESNVIIHNPGPENPQPNMTINRNAFETARKAKGTDEDIVFIHRKH